MGGYVPTYQVDMDTHKRRAADSKTPPAGGLAWRERFPPTSSSTPLPLAHAFEPHPDQSCAAITPSLHDTHFDVPPAGPIRGVGTLVSLRSSPRLEAQCTPDSHCIRADPDGVSSA